MSTPKPMKNDTNREKEASKVQVKSKKATKNVPGKSTAEEQKSAEAKNKEPTMLENGMPQNERKGEKPDDLGSKKQEKKPCEEKKKEKRDILKLLEDCERRDIRKSDDKCCTWHKYVLYALPLAAYLPWLFRMAKCPPKCCPPKYCCPCNCEPFCPPSKLACGPRKTGCPRLCSPEADPCADKEPQCKESDKYSV